jgi:hypothetical protein
VPATDGVDARARRVAARLLSTRSWRTTHRTVRVKAPSECCGAGLSDPPPETPRTRPVSGGHPARAARVARTLESLAGEGWVVLSGVHRPGGRSRPIDHLLIGPGGIVLVDSHLWTGRIEVVRGVVERNGTPCEAETAEVARVAGSVAALLLPQHRTSVHALITVAQHNLTHRVVDPGVHVVGITRLTDVLRGLPTRLHPAEVFLVHTRLGQILGGAQPPEQLTTAELGGVPCPAAPADGHRPSPCPDGDGQSRRATPEAAARACEPRPWPRPGWRTFAVRMVAAVLVAIIAILLGPSAVHREEKTSGQAPGWGPEPAAAALAPRPSAVTPLPVHRTLT